MIAAPLLDYADRKAARERERLQRLAASGASGCVEARKKLEALTTAELKRAVGRA